MQDVINGQAIDIEAVCQEVLEVLRTGFFNGTEVTDLISAEMWVCRRHGKIVHAVHAAMQSRHRAEYFALEKELRKRRENGNGFSKNGHKKGEIETLRTKQSDDEKCQIETIQPTLDGIPKECRMVYDLVYGAEKLTVREACARAVAGGVNIKSASLAVKFGRYEDRIRKFLQQDQREEEKASSGQTTSGNGFESASVKTDLLFPEAYVELLRTRIEGEGLSVAARRLAGSRGFARDESKRFVKFCHNQSYRDSRKKGETTERIRKNGKQSAIGTSEARNILPISSGDQLPALNSVEKGGVLQDRMLAIINAARAIAERSKVLQGRNRELEDLLGEKNREIIYLSQQLAAVFAALGELEKSLLKIE